MKNTKRISAALLILLIAAVSVLAGCSTDAEESETVPEPTGGRKVLLSLYNDNDPWPVALANDIKKSCTENGIELDIKNAKGSKDKQYNDIAALEDGEYDMVLLSSVDREVGGDCVELCNEKNIPAMLVARNADKLLGPDCITLIACDYDLVGYSQALSLMRVFGIEDCRIVELTGEPGASTTVSLTRGFQRAVETYPNLKIVTSRTVTDSTRGALDAMESIIQDGTRFQAVFCHSDADALGAIQALKTAGLTPGCDPGKGEIIITSNCGFDDAIKAVATGELYNTFDLNARLGDLVVNTMNKYWDGEVIVPRIQITYHEITKQNADQYIGSGY